MAQPQTYTSQSVNKYFETTVQTATPAQLLIMLCDGAIRFSKQAIEALHHRRFNEAHNCLSKVQDIIREFIITLDRNSPIAENLLSLYEYFMQKLIEGNVKKQVGPVQEVLGFLVELKETWVQAAKAANANHPGVIDGTVGQ